jgi:septal ring factor EnvC (AmiA/AmiB activator)
MSSKHFRWVLSLVLADSTLQMKLKEREDEAKSMKDKIKEREDEAKSLRAGAEETKLLKDKLAKSEEESRVSKAKLKEREDRIVALEKQATASPPPSSPRGAAGAASGPALEAANKRYVELLPDRFTDGSSCVVLQTPRRSYRCWRRRSRSRSV